MRTRAKQGFTLIELLTVIAILAILVAILMPTLRRVLSAARGVTTASRINALNAGCLQFKQDTGLYPLQDNTGAIAGKASNLLARVMWTKGANFPVSNYCDYKPEFFQTAGDPNSGISDGTSSPLAILYFPSHIGAIAADQFVQADNSTYCDPNKDGDFGNWIKNPENPADPSTVTNALTKKRNGAFVLVGAGPDGKFFTKDDFLNN